GCVGARIRWRRPVLLRWRKERQGKDRPPSQTELRDWQRPQGFGQRLHEQIIEAGRLRSLLSITTRSKFSTSSRTPIKCFVNVMDLAREPTCWHHGPAPISHFAS